jgi:hypothetical protein
MYEGGCKAPLSQLTDTRQLTPRSRESQDLDAQNLDSLVTDIGHRQDKLPKIALSRKFWKVRHLPLACFSHKPSTAAADLVMETINSRLQVESSNLQFGTCNLNNHYPCALPQ